MFDCFLGVPNDIIAIFTSRMFFLTKFSDLSRVINDALRRFQYYKNALVLQ